MCKATRILAIVVLAGGFSLLGMGCENGQKADAEHPAAEHPNNGEHPSNGEHPNAEHPEAEHPQGEHPQGEHPEHPDG